MALGAVVCGAAAVVLTALLAGTCLLRLARVSGPATEWLSLSFVLGSGFSSLLVFALCSLGLVSWVSFSLLTAVLAVLAWRLRVPWLVAREQWPRQWPGQLFLVIYAVFGLYYTLHALAPEMSPDGSGYHLALPARYWREHGFVKLPHSLYAALSQGVELLYLPSAAIGGPSSAALVHLAFFACLPWLLIGWAQRHGVPHAGYFAAALVFCSPAFAWDATSAYNDVALAATLFAAFLLADMGRRTQNLAVIALAGFCAGFCYAIKYTGFLAPLVLILPIASASLRQRRGSRPVLVFAAAASLAVLPWMLRNALWFGNPLAPFANSWFPNAYFAADEETAYTGRLADHHGLSLASMFVDVTARGEWFRQLLGPLFLLFPASSLAVRRSGGGWLIVLALVFCYPFVRNAETRFLLGAVPFAALALGLTLARWPVAAGAAVLLSAVLAWPDVPKWYASPQSQRLPTLRQVKWPWAQALRLQPEQATLRRYLPSYRVLEMVEAHTEPGARIFTQNSTQDAYTTRELIVSWTSTASTQLRDLLYCARMDELRPTRQVTFRFPAVVLRGLRLTQTVAAPVESWSMAEWTVLHQGRAYSATRQWQASTSLHPWDAGLMLDGDPVTRWRSHSVLRRGSEFTVVFEAPLPVDTLQVLSSQDHNQARFRLQCLTPEGAWEPCGGEPQFSRVEPAADLRRRAMAAMKRAGIAYLLVAPGDWAAEDFAQCATDWGIQLVAEQAGHRLYRLEEPPPVQ